MVAGLTGFRSGSRRTRAALALAVAAATGAALLWHGPLGAADRFAAAVEREARLVLDDWEMQAVGARLQRSPLSRRLELSGPADAFQRGELMRLMDLVPGVRGATWRGERTLPLMLEGAVAAWLGLLVGALIAYLVELRRRYNRQWSW